ncbi:type II toxin-antitoxin system PemK/MazF family toxin [uncultured Nostoc sp.]|uniref:type II toxin-antitoxin system PemK/MazF family toxin n=1 Tax=uncultured Nostoc sp. TaxID=340711 RepID=UPI0035CC1B2B
MRVQRGEVWLANLDPTKGSEQRGTRPVIIFQDDIVAEFSTTVIIIPLTTNLRRVSLPTCLLIQSGEGGLERDSVALCHQLRVIDKTRLQIKVGVLTLEILTILEGKVLLTLGYQL